MQVNGLWKKIFLSNLCYYKIQLENYFYNRIWIKSFKNPVRHKKKIIMTFKNKLIAMHFLLGINKYYNTSFIFILECHKTTLRWAPMRGCSAHCPDPQRWWLYVDFVSHNSSETTMRWQHPYIFFAYHSNRKVRVTWSPHGAPSAASCCGEIEVISLII